MINQTVLWFAVISVIDGYTQVQLFDNVLALRPYLPELSLTVTHEVFLTVLYGQETRPTQS